jgi:hypothetical protein
MESCSGIHVALVTISFDALTKFVFDNPELNQTKHQKEPVRLLLNEYSPSQIKSLSPTILQIDH